MLRREGTPPGVYSNCEVLRREGTLPGVYSKCMQRAILISKSFFSTSHSIFFLIFFFLTPSCDKRTLVTSHGKSTMYSIYKLKKTKVKL